MVVVPGRGEFRSFKPLHAMWLLNETAIYVMLEINAFFYSDTVQLLGFVLRLSSYPLKVTINERSVGGR